jgi:DnaJ-class molecular chaperone
MMSRSHYLTLGISRNESADGIRRAFCGLVKRYHPDRLGFPGLSFFQEIVNAYRVLANPERRRNYDEGLSHSGGRAALLIPVILDSGAEPGSLVPEIGLPLRVSMMRASFEAAFARVAERLKGDGRPADGRSEGLDVQMILPPEMAARGGVAFVTVPSCAPCPICGGSGQDELSSCASCDGEGISEDEETVSVRVPPMTSDGMLLEVPLRGLGVHNYYLRLQMRVGE